MNTIKYRTLAELHECTCTLKVHVDWTVGVLSVAIRSLRTGEFFDKATSPRNKASKIKKKLSV